MICDLCHFFFFILGWVFLLVQLRHQQKSSQQEHLPSNEPPHQTADRGGKERRVTVKMTSLGVCWDTGPLSSILSAPPLVSGPVSAALPSFRTSVTPHHAHSDFVYM